LAYRAVTVRSWVEMKIFVFVFSRKFIFAFREKSLQKVTKITKIFAKLLQKQKCMRKRAQETGNIVKYLKMSNPDGASK
jgi:hypothetical protein